LTLLGQTTGRWDPGDRLLHRRSRKDWVSASSAADVDGATWLVAYDALFVGMADGNVVGLARADVDRGSSAISQR
jgi:hypothetical protein